MCRSFVYSESGKEFCSHKSGHRRKHGYRVVEKSKVTLVSWRKGGWVTDARESVKARPKRNPTGRGR